MRFVKSFLAFESKGCLRLGSFPLIPKNDASLLLINSGMAPMKPWFQNPETAPKRRVTTCQKCIRTGDIEMSERLHVTALSLKCSVTSLSEITLKRGNCLGVGILH